MYMYICIYIYIYIHMYISSCSHSNTNTCKYSHTYICMYWTMQQNRSTAMDPATPCDKSWWSHGVHLYTHTHTHDANTPIADPHAAHMRPAPYLG